MNEYDSLKKLVEMDDRVKYLEKIIEDGVRIFDSELNIGYRVPICDLGELIWRHVKDDGIHVPEKKEGEKK